MIHSVITKGYKMNKYKAVYKPLNELLSYDDHLWDILDLLKNEGINHVQVRKVIHLLQKCEIEAMKKGLIENE